MNLNEFVINRGRGQRGRRSVRNKNFTNMGPPLAPPIRKKDYTPSSDLNWGKSHISVTDNSSIHKSAGSSKISAEEDSRVIVALTEGRGDARCEVGIAAINVSRPLLILCQISDTQSYVNTLTKINIFNPQEILVPLTFVENFSGNRLIDKVKEHFPRIKYTGCVRSTFNKANGMDVLSNLCIPSLNAILLVLQHKYYALAAASALITYVQDNLFVYYATGSIKIEYQESEGYAVIDVATADRLELVCSAKPAQGNKYSSLFGILNHCLTKIGSRTLRSSILQPPCEIQYIEERLEAVAELIKHPEMLLSIQALLQKVSNIDLLLSIGTIIPNDSRNCSNRQLNYVLLVNTLIDLITPLREVLAKSPHPSFSRLAETLASDAFGAIKTFVRNTVQENAHPAKGEAAVMQRCFAIKPGVNGLLDLVRKTYSERLDDMREYVKKLGEKYDLPLTLGNNQTKGHHMVLSLNQKQKRYMKKSDLPEEFIEVCRLAGSFTMKTPVLTNFSTRLDDIMGDILRVSNVMVHSIIVEIKKYASLFYELCEQIAYLDVLQSLAECSVRNAYTRPKFGAFTEVSFAHHPLLDYLLPTKPIPNPISCSDDYNLHVITGPNGSGKSIFIRQVMLLQVMAQVGCYVPAKSAIFRPADRMYARIYLEDNMERGASSFILEMKELKCIMSTMTENSLVIIDELCRSTSLEEGTALAMAIMEKLAQSSAFIYITTHFTLLTKLYDMYPNVKVWHLETIPSGEDPKTVKLDFRHNLVSGATTVKRYGVYIVRNIWPDSILKYVDALLEKIMKQPKKLNIKSLDEKIRLKYDVESQFRKLKSQRKLTVPEINKLLNRYQSGLEKLGYLINVAPLPPHREENVVRGTPMIQHSVFGDMQEISSVEDLGVANAIMQQFTPENSFSHEAFAQSDTQRTAQRIRAVFTPESTGQSQFMNYTNENCPNVEFYQGRQTASDTNDPDGAIYGGYRNDDHFRDNSDDNYGNISRFLAENSENMHKLIPEVQLSYEDLSKPGSARQSSLVNINEVQFSLPLHSDATKTSTPIARRPQQPSPTLRFYGHGSGSINIGDHQNSSAFIPEQIALEGYDIESIQEDLEVCSRIFNEEDDDFDEESPNTTYKSIPSSCNQTEYRFAGWKPPEQKGQHIIPVVRVVEGPNNTTLSFDEDNFHDIPEFGDVEKPTAVQNKINIISNIVIAPGELIRPRRDEEIVTERDTSNKVEEVVEQSDFHEFLFEDKAWTDKYDDVMKNRETFKDVNSEKEPNTEKLYKHFDSTFEPDTIDESDHFDEPADYSSDENGRFVQSSTFKVEKNQEKSNNTSSGYDIAAIDDPKQFITSSSADKTTSKGKSASTDKNEVNPFQILEEQQNSTPSKVEVTSISYASKARGLDRSISDFTQQEEDDTRRTSSDKTITSVSSASRKRNLEQITTDSTNTIENSGSKTKESDSSSSLKESDESNPKIKPPKRKLSAPIDALTEESSTQTKKVDRPLANRKKFVPPRKLTAKEIREEFKEQDRKLLESSPTSSNFSKHLAQLMKRPTVEQVRNTTHLATIRKTGEGVEVIPAKPPRKKTKHAPWKKQFSNENFNVTMFSDKNALPFESYLNSNEKDYSAFSFQFNKSQGAGLPLGFAPTTSSVGEYTSNSVTKRFVRAVSETMDDQLGNGDKMLDITFRASQSRGHSSLTPDGYYKQNREDIKRILDKYLERGGTQEREAVNTGRSTRSRSIFDTSDIDANDLNI